MPGLGSTPPSNQKEETAKKPLVRSKTVTVNFRPLKIEAGGRKYSFFGESKCGKTISALTMGYMSKEYIPELRKEGFKYIPYALENNIFPSIDRIIFVDSEGTLENQLAWPMENRVAMPLIGKLIDEKRFEYVTIDAASKHEIIEEGKIKVDPESVEKLVTAGDTYVASIDKAIELYNDKHTLLIVDSCTRLKWVLDQLADVIYRVKVATGESKGEPSMMPMEKYGPRNAEWMRLTTLMKHFKGTVVMTFMMTDAQDWVVKMAEESKNEKMKTKFHGVYGTRKIETIDKGHEYTFDEEIMFDKNEDDKRFCIIKNYRGLQEHPFKEVFLSDKTKFSFLRCLEDMLTLEVGELPPEVVKNEKK